MEYSEKAFAYFYGENKWYRLAKHCVYMSHRKVYHNQKGYSKYKVIYVNECGLSYKCKWRIIYACRKWSYHVNIASFIMVIFLYTQKYI